MRFLRMLFRYWTRGESFTYQRRTPAWVERRRVSHYRFHEENQ